MSEFFDTLIGLDPNGDVALLLCIATACLLSLLILLGFGLLHSAGFSPRSGPDQRTTTVGDLDMRTLWRLTRSTRDHTETPETHASPPAESSTSSR